MPVPVPVPAPTCPSLPVPDSWVSIKSTSSPKAMCPGDDGGFYQVNGNGGWGYGGGGDGCYVTMDEFTTVSPRFLLRLSQLQPLIAAGDEIRLSSRMSAHPFPGQEL